MEINWLVVATITAPILALFLGVALDRFLKRKPKVQYYLGNVSAFQLRTGSRSQIYTHSIVVMNIGRKTAKEVQIGHNYLPPDFNIYPLKEYEIVEIDGGKNIRIPTLIPKETITISYLYFPPCTWHQVNTSVKHEDGIAKKMSVFPAQIYPKWQLGIFGMFLLVGIISPIYLLYEFIYRFIKVVFLSG